jgi:hypothetical protein
MTYELGTVTSTGVQPVMDASNTPLTRSRRDDRYPLRMDGANGVPDLNFGKYPGVPLEEDRTEAWRLPSGISPEQYPDLVLVIDGLGSLNGGMVTDNGTFPSRDVAFGDAVTNAVELITTDGQNLVDYNLDGDRGYGWKTWHPKEGTNPANPPVAVEPEP